MQKPKAPSPFSLKPKEIGLRLYAPLERLQGSVGLITGNKGLYTRVLRVRI